MLIDVDGIFLDVQTVILCAPCRVENGAESKEPYSHLGVCENCGFPDATTRLARVGAGLEGGK